MGKRHSSVMDYGYRASIIDEAHVTTGDITVVVTTPAEGSYWLAYDVSAAAVTKVTLTEDVAIDTPGTVPIVFYNRNRQGDHPDAYPGLGCACLIEQGGTYSGGAVTLTRVELRGEGDNHTLLEQSTSYLITVATKADTNYTSLTVWVWQGEASEV